MEWIERNVPGLPSIAEAYGPAVPGVRALLGEHRAPDDRRLGLPRLPAGQAPAGDRAAGRRTSPRSSPRAKSPPAGSFRPTAPGSSSRGARRRAEPGGGEGLRRLQDLLEPVFSRKEVALYRVRLGPGSERRFRKSPESRLRPPSSRPCRGRRGWRSPAAWPALRTARSGSPTSGTTGSSGSSRDCSRRSPSAAKGRGRARVPAAERPRDRGRRPGLRGGYLELANPGPLSRGHLALRADRRPLRAPRAWRRTRKGGSSSRTPATAASSVSGPDGKMEKEWGRSGPDQGRLNEPDGDRRRCRRDRLGRRQREQPALPVRPRRAPPPRHPGPRLETGGLLRAPRSSSTSTARCGYRFPATARSGNLARKGRPE